MVEAVGAMYPFLFIGGRPRDALPKTVYLSLAPSSIAEAPTVNKSSAQRLERILRYHEHITVPVPFRRTVLESAMRSSLRA